MNRWKQNNIVLDRKTIIWQLFGGYIYCLFFVVAMEVSDVRADLGVHLSAVKTVLTKIHVSLEK